MKKYLFDTNKYKFKEIILEYLQVNELEKIDIPNIKLNSGIDCLNTPYHKIYNSTYNTNPKLKNLYGNFIKEFVANLFDEEILYEKKPNIRIHYQNNLSVFDYHKDKEYLVKSGLEDLYSNEINFWFPLTDAYDTNTTWVESEEDKGDYFPINSFYGEIIQFDGANLMHGNKINITQQTRVSLDFRILSKKLFFDFANENKKNKNLIQYLVNYYSKVV
jgi:hypothetical protein